MTLGSYNDGKRGFLGWGKNDEHRLYKWLDRLNETGNLFVLSNIVKHGEKTNHILLDWLDRSNYDSKEIKHRDRTELLIKNY